MIKGLGSVDMAQSRQDAFCRITQLTDSIQDTNELQGNGLMEIWIENRLSPF